MSENFAELFEESQKTLEMNPGCIVTGVVIDVDKDWVTVHAGLKSEGVIPASQFLDNNDELTVAIGDEVQVVLETVEDGFGETRLSREKAKRAESWKNLEMAQETEQVVKGVISSKVKGGFTVDIESIRAFLPGSLVDVRPVRDTVHLEGKELEFKVIKLDQARNNVVVSRRAVMEEANSAEFKELIANLEEGIVIKGVVKNLTDYGAFIDLGGIDGLLHITDMAWKRIKHPSEIIAIGDEIEARVLKFDRERNRVSLGLKQLGEDPWVAIAERYAVNSRAKAVVTNLTDYGCFAEIEDGIEGLVHVSEMDWTNRNLHPSKIVQVGDEVDVMILSIDADRRRISLGMKQCQENPWDIFDREFSKGDKISGKIKSITDFGIFIGLNGGIDGLVHLSDISWNESGKDAVHQYKKGDDLETVILAIDAERERISLGIKQLEMDAFSDYLSENQKGTIVKGVVKEVDAATAVVTLADDVEGILKASEVSRDKVEDVRTVMNVGDEIEAKIISIDHKKRTIALSIKSKDIDEEQDAVKKHSTQQAEVAPVNATIGDLIKAAQKDISD